LFSGYRVDWILFWRGGLARRTDAGRGRIFAANGKQRDGSGPAVDHLARTRGRASNGQIYWRWRDTARDLKTPSRQPLYCRVYSLPADGNISWEATAKVMPLGSERLVWGFRRDGFNLGVGGGSLRTTNIGEKLGRGDLLGIYSLPLVLRATMYSKKELKFIVGPDGPPMRAIHWAGYRRHIWRWRDACLYFLRNSSIRRSDFPHPISFVPSTVADDPFNLNTKSFAWPVSAVFDPSATLSPDKQ